MSDCKYVQINCLNEMFFGVLFFLSTIAVCLHLFSFTEMNPNIEHLQRYSSSLNKICLLYNLYPVFRDSFREGKREALITQGFSSYLFYN